MAAALQAVTTSGKPVLLRANDAAGHFADTIAHANSDWTDIYSFALWNLDDPQFQPATASDGNVPLPAGDVAATVEGVIEFWK